jgi:hypothetical protein
MQQQLAPVFLLFRSRVSGGKMRARAGADFKFERERTGAQKSEL